MSGDILPAVCPDTPKYLEAQYQCISHRQEERSSQYKLPELGGNISDVWSQRDIVLDREAVEDAIKTVIREAHIPVTERHQTVSVQSDHIEKQIKSIKVLTSVNNDRKLLNKSDGILCEEDCGTSSPHILPKLSQSETRPKSDSEWTSKEVLIIILTSALCVSLVTITAAVFLVKVKSKYFRSYINIFYFQTRTACLVRKPGENLEMSGTGSSAESDCSVYTLSTNINSENFRNFQHRFHQFKPEVETPHIFDTNSLSDRSDCCGNHSSDENQNIRAEHMWKYGATPNTSTVPTNLFPSGIPYLMPAHHCSGNIHINYNISYNPSLHTCPCQSSVLNTNIEPLASEHYSRDSRYVCDV